MNKIITTCVLIFLFLMGCSNQSQKEVEPLTEQSKELSQIFPVGDLITNDYFNGKAWHKRLVTDVENFDATVGNVLYEPGTRNNWHSHPGGQILLCISGKGYYQEKGKPIQLVNVGDVVEILPNVVHWHGARPDCEFEHIAIAPQQHKGSVTWLEPVSDEEYNSFNQ